MVKKSGIGRALISIIVMVLFIAPVSSVLAIENKTERIKVGYYEDGDYMSLNQQGEYVGYNIEYLQEIAKQSGLDFEIIDAVSWSDAYNMLVRGEIDLLPAVYQTDERAKEILFSTQSMCNIYTTLNVRMDDERYDYEDFQAFQGMNVGIIRNSIDGDNFRKFCVEHLLTLNIIEYDETSVLLNALDDGTLDAVAITHLGKNSTFRSVSQFAPSSLYITVTKGKPEVMAEINKAMNNIQLSNPGYGNDLYEKYLAPSINQNPVFTKEEREYIEQAEPIVVAYDPAFAPFSYQDKETREFNGVSADVFKIIEENSGLQFEFKAYTQPEALKQLAKGNIDVLSVSDGDYLWDSRNNINSTLYYLRAPTSMLSIAAEEKPEVLALPEGYQLSEAIEAGSSNYKIKYYLSIEDCLQAVLDGEADAACMNTQVAGAYLCKSDFKKMHTATLGQYINEICIGVSASQDARLFSIINKCIQYIPAEQIDASLVAHSADTKEVTLMEFLEENILTVIGVVCFVLGVIILLISYNLKNALRSNRRIQNLLYKDELTGLYNMNGFCQRWEEKVEKISHQNYVLLYGDICQFKFINDNFGFATGNQVLQISSKILQEIMSDEEFCGRISSDHFSILMKYESWGQLLIRLNKIIDELNLWRMNNTDIPYKIEFIFGAYLNLPEDETDIHQQLDFANYARRYAKDNIGDFVVLYDEQMRNQARLAQELEGGLERALKENQFTVYYQPQVSMKDGSLIGSEALIRWNHPDKGFLMPGNFIPLFENNGKVKKIDLWLFENVCKTMNKWSKKGMKLLPVSCNFSRLHFQQESFPHQVCEIADRWNIPHHLLELEITESAILEGSTNFESMFITLKNLGFKIAIDDFGSGYSSLGQLQQLSADVLKLDRSFVCHGVTGKREQIVVENVIHMASELGMSVICEGVETLTQSDILQGIGCRLAQGYYFYRPMKLEDYENLIK